MLMKNIKKYHVLILCGVLCMLIGSVLTVKGNKQSRKLITESQNETLFQLADSADKNLANTLSRIHNQIYYISSSTDFRDAERSFQENGTKYALWDILRYNSLCESDLIEGIIGLKDGSTFLSTRDGHYNNIHFYDNMGNYRIKLCESMEGKFYMAFQFNGNYSDIKYYALIDLDRLYLQIADDAADYISQVILYNNKLNILITSVDGTVKTMRMSEYWKSGYEDIGEYIGLRVNDARNSAQMLESTDAEGNAKRLYLATIPVQICKNKNFSVTIITDYDRMYTPLRNININLISNIAIVAAGLCMLFCAYMLIRTEHRRVNIELNELKEKNEATKRLLEQTKKLEHIQRLELLGTMTSGISHEFNNLLTPIMGYSIMSLEMVPEGNDELSENIIEIYNASKKAKDIVKRISELSRKNSSDSLVAVNIDELILKVKSMIKPSTPENVNILLKLNAKEACVRANETQMTQVVMNIMLNGIHAMEKNGGTLSVSTAMENDDTMYIRIKDSGTGIAPEILPHIFDPFFTTKESGKGTGLGLAIVKNILDELGAVTQIRSEIGIGTEFIIKLNVMKPAES